MIDGLVYFIAHESRDTMRKYLVFALDIFSLS